MKVEDLKALIANLPDDMTIITPLGDGQFVAVCNLTTRVLPVTYPDSPTEDMLVIYPCFCNDEDDDDSGIDLPINLN